MSLQAVKSYTITFQKYNLPEEAIKRGVRVHFNPITIIIIVAFIYPIAKGYLFKFSSHNMKNDIHELTSNISFVASLFLGVYLCKVVFIERSGQLYNQILKLLPSSIFDYIESNVIIYYVVVIPLVIFIIYWLVNLIFELINGIVFYPLVDLLERFMNDKSNFLKRISGALFQLPRAIGYVLLAAFIFNILSIINIGDRYNNYLETSKPYKLLCQEVIIPVTNSTVAKQLPNVLNNSFKVVIKDASAQDSLNNITEKLGNRRVIIYYNGITLDEGVKSSSKIDSFARELGSRGNTSKDKAQLIYRWIGNNISYDDDKANAVLNNDFNIKSGAIPTFQTKKGICFDYACLYVAMARANGLKVRIITGEGFNGVSWVSHAWNQVYIPEEDRWINVDPTFFKGGNYFDSKQFLRDHKDSKIAGEWQ